MRRLATRKTQSEEAVLHVIGLTRWAWASARSCASRRLPLVAGWAAGRR
jgi:hypothetical protein